MVAVGPNVTINAILGLPFIKQTKIIAGAADQVAELRALDALLFPINFHSVQCHVLTINETKVYVNMTRYADIIQEINNIEQSYSTIPAVQHTATPPSPKGGLLKKRSHPNLQVRINPAFSPAQEHGIPSISHNLEPFNVVTRLSATTVSTSIVTKHECCPLVIHHNQCVIPAAPPW